MELKVIGSSSAGNCYILDNGEEALIIECGTNSKEIFKAVDFDTLRVKACLISHEHGDHSKSVKDIIANGIPVVCSKGTAEALHLDKKITLAADNCPLTLGKWLILPFNVKHDAAEPLGFIIYHNDMGFTFFATDTNEIHLSGKYRNIAFRHILIECNYSEEKLTENVFNGLVNEHLAQRIRNSHLSLERCIEAMFYLDTKQVINIVLIHNSETNSDKQFYLDCINEAMNGEANVILAKPNLSVKFNKFPF